MIGSLSCTEAIFHQISRHHPHHLSLLDIGYSTADLKDSELQHFYSRNESESVLLSSAKSVKNVKEISKGHQIILVLTWARKAFGIGIGVSRKRASE